MLRFEKSSIIYCDIDALYNFHLDATNLQAITPKQTKLTLLSKNFSPQEGEIMALRVVENFIPMYWKVKIEKLSKPNLLVDVAIKSPFKFWKHSHIFKVLDNKSCELTDIIEYTLPLSFISHFLFQNFIEQKFLSLFEYRHKVTKELLEKSKI